MAWEGTYAEAPGTKIRVEAAAYKGRPTNFQILLPWHTAEAEAQPRSRGPRWGALVPVTLAAIVLVGGPVLLARRHVRAGRGDRSGADRLAVWVLASSMAGWTIGTHHVPSPYELDLVMMAVATSLLGAAYVWLLYLALEPYVRRTAPFAIVSWARVVSGRHRDPLVGRDVLAGTAWGTAIGALALAAARVPAWLGRPAVPPRRELLNALLGWREIVESILGIAVGSALVGMMLILIWSVAHGVLGRRRVALAVTFVASASLTLPVFAPESIDLMLAMAAVFGAATTWLAVRFGLLSLIVGIGVKSLFAMPLTSDLAAWTSGPTLGVIAVLALLAGWSTRTTLADRPLLSFGG
jgi:hypothetical protein